MLWQAKYRQAVLAVRTGKATVISPPPPAPGFRGLPALDAARCLGCGACATACPSRLITVADQPGARLWKADFGRCIYCGRCAEVCPSGAIAMTDRYETAITDPAALRISATLELAQCSRCGRPLGVARNLAEFFPDPGGLCPACKRRRWAGRLKGGARRA